ncbi:MAG: hypothetical protein AAFP15_19960, partial [Bacteroidota bacterium]
PTAEPGTGILAIVLAALVAVAKFLAGRLSRSCGIHFAPFIIGDTLLPFEAVLDWIAALTL